MSLALASGQDTRPPQILAPAGDENTAPFELVSPSRAVPSPRAKRRPLDKSPHPHKSPSALRLAPPSPFASPIARRLVQRSPAVGPARAPLSPVVGSYESFLEEEAVLLLEENAALTQKCDALASENALLFDCAADMVDDETRSLRWQRNVLGGLLVVALAMWVWTTSRRAE